MHLCVLTGTNSVTKGRLPQKICGLNMSFFQKASDPPPLTFGIFEALFSVGLTGWFF